MNDILENEKAEIPENSENQIGNELEKISERLSLYMPDVVLYEILRCFRVAKTEPSDDMLLSLDAIWHKISTRPQNIAISDVFAENEEIIRTLNDLYEKAKHTGIYNKSPLTLSEIVSVASKYLTRTGAYLSDRIFLNARKDDLISLTFSDKDNNGLALMSFDTKAPLPYGYEKNEKLYVVRNESCYDLASNDFEIDFIKRIKNRLTLISPSLSAEKFSPTKYSELKIAFDGEASALEAHSVVSFDSYSLSAHLCRECSFTNGINSVLDSLFALLAAGIDRRYVSLAIKYELDPQNISGTLAAMLGAYRAMMELCIPDTGVDIEVKDTQSPSMLCIATSDKPLPKSNQSVVEKFAEGNALYLLTFKRFTDTSPTLMPDFESVRNMCDKLHSMLISGAAVSARAFDGSLSDEIKKLCPEGCFVDTEGFRDHSSTLAQGFIIETKPNRKALQADPIGIIRKITVEENARDEQTDGDAV